MGLHSNIPEDEEPVIAGVLESGSLIVSAAVRVGYTLLTQLSGDASGDIPEH
jgi:hypothetical protein